MGADLCWPQGASEVEEGIFVCHVGQQMRPDVSECGVVGSMKSAQLLKDVENIGLALWVESKPRFRDPEIL